MEKVSPDMQISHSRSAKYDLLFCNAAIYFDFSQSDRGLASRNQERESNTDMSISSIALWFENWKRYRAAVRELSMLSDRELDDLGIRRAEIDSVARQSVKI